MAPKRKHNVAPVQVVHVNQVCTDTNNPLLVDLSVQYVRADKLPFEFMNLLTRAAGLNGTSLDGNENPEKLDTYREDDHGNRTVFLDIHNDGMQTNVKGKDVLNLNWVSPDVFTEEVEDCFEYVNPSAPEGIQVLLQVLIILQ